MEPIAFVSVVCIPTCIELCHGAQFCYPYTQDHRQIFVKWLYDVNLQTDARIKIRSVPSRPSSFISCVFLFFIFVCVLLYDIHFHNNNRSVTVLFYETTLLSVHNAPHFKDSGLTSGQLII